MDNYEVNVLTRKGGWKNCHKKLFQIQIIQIIQIHID